MLEAIPVLAYGLILAVLWLMFNIPGLRSVASSLANALPPPPVISWQQIFGGVGSWFKSIGTWVNNQTAPAWQAVWAHNSSHRIALQGTVDAASSLFQGQTRIVQRRIPAAVSSANAHSDHSAQLIRGELHDQVGQAESLASTAVSGEASARRASEAALWDATVGLAEQVQGQDLRAVATEGSARTAADTRLERLLNIDIQDVRSQTESSISGEATLRAAGDRGLQINLDLQGQQLRGLITGGLATLAALDGAQLLREVMRASTAERAIAQDVTDIKDSECMKFCSPLGTLGQALTLIDLAAIVALVAEAYHDPGAATALVKDVLSPLASEGEQLLKEITAA